MSSANAIDSINANQVRPTGTTRPRPASVGAARPASTARSRSAGASPAIPATTSKADPVSANSIPPANPNNVLRRRMADELSMAGLAPSSQRTYLNAVDRLAARSWKSIEEMTEQDVKEHLLDMRDNGAARGTFKTAWFGIQFLYHHVLDRNWSLFGKKRSASRLKGAFLASSPMTRCSDS